MRHPARAATGGAAVQPSYNTLYNNRRLKAPPERMRLLQPLLLIESAGGCVHVRAGSESVHVRRGQTCAAAAAAAATSNTAAGIRSGKRREAAEAAARGMPLGRVRWARKEGGGCARLDENS